MPVPSGYVWDCGSSAAVCQAWLHGREKHDLARCMAAAEAYRMLFRCYIHRVRSDLNRSLPLQKSTDLLLMSVACAVLVRLYVHEVDS